MKKLSTDWFLEGTPDLEYKQYILLAYLKQVQDQFSLSMLYPAFSDLISQYKNLLDYRENSKKIREKFPKKLKGLDLEKRSLVYEPLQEEGEPVELVNQVVDYSLPRIKLRIEEGREIYEQIEEKIEIDTVGIVPLYRKEGYILVRSATFSSEVRAFQYQLSLIEQDETRFCGIHTEFVEAFRYGVSTSYEAIKLELIRHRPELPNPATFLLYSPLLIPEKESLLPVAKRKFMRYLAKI